MLFQRARPFQTLGLVWLTSKAVVNLMSKLIMYVAFVERQDMAATFLVVSDDSHKAFFNADLICMFRLKKAEDGNIADPEELEIEFIGGTKTRLVGETAKHFLSAISKLITP